MRRIAALVLPFLALAAQPAAAQVIAYADITVDEPAAAERLMEAAVVVEAAAPRFAVAYGPFRVLDESHAALVDITDAASPRDFAAMLRDHPGIAAIEMVNCPGTDDDRANLRLGLMMRARGVATHVPDDGWVASGAVELFLAGARRSAEATARFAVHSWEDDQGREANDYAPDAPKNRAYLDYYRAVGMSAEEARAFYAMTNSTPFEQARMLTRAEMAQWVRLDAPQDAPQDAPGEQPPPGPLGGRTILAALDSKAALH